MSKRGSGKYFGLAALAAAAAVFVKYLKDYTDFKDAAEPDLSNLKDSTGAAKEAAKRTYISIRDKAGVKEAAGDLAKAAGRMAMDAGNVAAAAGRTTVDTVKDIKNKYDTDPEAAKEEVIGNLKDMKDDITDSISEAADKLSGLWKKAEEECEDTSEACCEEETAEEAEEEETADAIAANADASEAEEALLKADSETATVSDDTI